MTQHIGLKQLPDRFKGSEHSTVFTTYRDRKYSKYGFIRSKGILYGPEWILDSQSRSINPDRFRFVENALDGLRLVGDAHDIVRLKHTGWYVDNYQGETTHGQVFQLPGRDGEALYMPAVKDPWNDGCAIVDFRSITSDKEDAARWADSRAERWAEECREGEAKDQAEQRKEEIQEQIEQLVKEFRSLVGEIRENCEMLQGEGKEAIRKAIRKAAKEMRAERRQLRAEWKRLDEDFWSAV